MLKETDIKQDTFDLEAAQENLPALVKATVGNKRKTITVDNEPAVLLISVEHYQRLRKYIKELENAIEEMEDAADNRIADEMAARIAKGEVEIVPWEEAQKWFEADDALPT